jgi:hypothetical protein
MLDELRDMFFKLASVSKSVVFAQAKPYVVQLLPCLVMPFRVAKRHVTTFLVAPERVCRA